jgi:hypothetical protein
MQLEELLSTKIEGGVCCIEIGKQMLVFFLLFEQREIFLSEG